MENNQFENEIEIENGDKVNVIEDPSS